MGGYGSGRKHYKLKTLVEDCYCLSVSTFYKHLRAIDTRGGVHYGSLHWTCSHKEDARIGYQIFHENSDLIENRGE